MAGSCYDSLMTTFFIRLNSPPVLFFLVALFGLSDLVLLGRSYDLSKSDWSGWVQAIGALLAILASGLIASAQAARQFRDAAKLQHSANVAFELRIAKAIEAIASGTGKSVLHVIKCFEWNRDTVHYIATGHHPYDRNLIIGVQSDLDTISLHDLPSVELIVQVTRMRSIVRQVSENIERALVGYAGMEASAFENFFKMLDDAHRQLCQCIVLMGDEIETIEKSRK